MIRFTSYILAGSLATLLSTASLAAPSTSPAPGLTPAATLGDANGFNAAPATTARKQPMKLAQNSSNSGGCHDETGHQVPCSTDQGEDSGIGAGGVAAIAFVVGVTVAIVKSDNLNNHIGRPISAP